MDIVFQYPPELFQLLIDTIPLLFRSKRDVLTFFKGAGTDSELLEDLWQRVEQSRETITKYEITRTALTRLNSKGENTLRERREILKRVTQFEDFSTCWAEDQLKAKGLVAEIRRVINVKDTFTRITQELEKERQQKAAQHQKQVEEKRRKTEALQGLKQNFYALFSMTDKQKRGTLLEKILNRLFEVYGILIREAFKLTDDDGKGTVEQIDGAIEIDGQVYFVEMKWVEGAVNVDHVSRHLVRIYHRGFSRGMFISASGYTGPAIGICREALQKTVVVLCTLEELVRLLEQEKDLRHFLKDKINTAVLDKNPFKVFQGE